MWLLLLLAKMMITVIRPLSHEKTPTHHHWITFVVCMGYCASIKLNFSDIVFLSSIHSLLVIYLSI